MSNPFYDENFSTKSLRLIPAIDENSAVVEFAQSLAGKAIIAVLAGYLLCSMLGGLVWQMFFVCFIAVFLKFRRETVLICASAALWISWGPPLFWLSVGISNEYAAMSRITDDINLNLPVDSTWQLRAIVLLLGSGLIAGYLWFRARPSGKRAPGPVYLGILVSLALSLVLIHGHGLFLAPLWGTVTVVFVCLWGLAYACISSKKGFLERFALSMQGLIFGYCDHWAMITSPQNFSNQIAGPLERSNAVCRLKAIKLLVWSRLLLVPDDLGNYYLFGVKTSRLPEWLMSGPPGTLPDFGVVGRLQYNAAHLFLWQNWLVVLWVTFTFTIMASAWTGWPLALIRLTGIYTPRFVCRPYLARSFNEYFRRLLFYYSEVIVNFFYHPAMRFFKIMGPYRRWRAALSLFVAVGLGGWVAHLFNQLKYVLYFGQATAFGFFLSWIPYFLLVGLLCVISAQNWFGSRSRTGIARAVQLVVIFAMHGLLLLLVSLNVTDGWSDRIQMLRNLF